LYNFDIIKEREKRKKNLLTIQF